VRNANVPHLRKLMRTGAWTLEARAVMPSSSSPNWASMIMGAGPDLHGVTSNDWMPDKYDIKPAAVGSGGIFPTIFGTLREQRPDAIIAVFHDWEGFGRLLETNAPNKLLHVKDALETTGKALKYFRDSRPNFMFVHFDGVDHAGHGFGWRSEQYRKEVEMTDSLIGAFVNTVQEQGLRDKTIFLITADHGGLGTSHGGPSKQELEIPWILNGPGVARGKELKELINTFDTAPTLALILGIQPPKAWIGKPVLQAFDRGTHPEQKDSYGPAKSAALLPR
jgi:predicted AlkP superfamily pyrophosphatase or phosphodiesterase